VTGFVICRVLILAVLIANTNVRIKTCEKMCLYLEAVFAPFSFRTFEELTACIQLGGQQS